MGLARGGREAVAVVAPGDISLRPSCKAASPILGSGFKALGLGLSHLEPYNKPQVPSPVKRGDGWVSISQRSFSYSLVCILNIHD